MNQPSALRVDLQDSREDDMATPARGLKSKGGHKAKGKPVEFPKQPVVLHFPPSAYKVVQGDELKQWQREIKARLGLVFDVGGASAATVTYYQRGRTGLAYRSDSDIESGSDLAAKEERRGHLRRWDARPVVLHFPPAAYSVVGPEELTEWAAEIAQRLGVPTSVPSGIPGADTFHTHTYCEGPQGEGYPCDCDSV
jgi:hypothetical protein